MFEEQRHQYEARFYRAKNRFSLQCTFCQPIWPHHRLATLPLLHRSLLLIRMYIMLWSRAIFHADLVNISYMCPRYSWRAKLCSFFPYIHLFFSIEAHFIFVFCIYAFVRTSHCHFAFFSFSIYLFHSDILSLAKNQSRDLCSPLNKYLN